MKKILVVFIVCLLVLSAFLASCESVDTSSSEVSDTSSESSQPNKNENSKTESKDESKEESKPIVNLVDPTPAKPNTPPVGSDLSVIGCSFSEKPYFVLIGKCALNAEVTGEANGMKVTSKSYMGLFSVRLRCDEKSVKVKLSQTVDGVTVGQVLVYTATPITPSGDMWPVVAGGNLQFFFQKMLPDFEGKNIPPEASLTNLTQRIIQRTEQLKQYKPDAEIIYVLVPSAMTVYPELVPEQYKQTEGKSKLDLISEALTAGGATVIDLKTAFNEHKNDEMPLYFKLDSHWSDYGAFVAYTELFNHISKTFPEAKPHGIDEFNWRSDYYKSGDMAYYLGLSRYGIKEYSYYRTFNFPVPKAVTLVNRYTSEQSLTYSDDVTYERTIYTGDKTLPSAIVMRDSYSTQMYDILAERMNKTHYSGMWNYIWDNSRIKSVKPDYVIYIVAEWNLDSILNG
ncbi:MAG: hypothetical protein J6Q89_03305 [Clostridia bacterium]|nr:hypothetical protein [Clostridia bacterium]